VECVALLESILNVHVSNATPHYISVRLCTFITPCSSPGHQAVWHNSSMPIGYKSLEPYGYRPLCPRFRMLNWCSYSGEFEFNQTLPCFPSARNFILNVQNWLVPGTDSSVIYLHSFMVFFSLEMK